VADLSSATGFAFLLGEKFEMDKNRSLFPRKRISFTNRTVSLGHAGYIPFAISRLASYAMSRQMDAKDGL